MRHFDSRIRRQLRTLWELQRFLVVDLKIKREIQKVGIGSWRKQAAIAGAGRRGVFPLRRSDNEVIRCPPIAFAFSALYNLPLGAPQPYLKASAGAPARLARTAPRPELVARSGEREEPWMPSVSHKKCQRTL